MTARVVLLAGPSGSGKTSLTRRVGLPVLALDDFYRDIEDDADDVRTDPPLPRRFGIVDWDDPASWDAAAATAAVVRLCREGVADVPVYDIPTSRRTGTQRLDLAGARIFVAEGVFAAELVPLLRALPDGDQLLADALCLTLHPAVTFGRRLLRDLAESRKPPLTLVRRGFGLARSERALVERWLRLGCRACSMPEAETTLRSLA
jgi:uridine kinase